MIGGNGGGPGGGGLGGSGGGGLGGSGGGGLGGSGGGGMGGSLHAANSQHGSGKARKSNVIVARVEPSKTLAYTPCPDVLSKKAAELSPSLANPVKSGPKLLKMHCTLF